MSVSSASVPPTMSYMSSPHAAAAAAAHAHQQYMAAAAAAAAQAQQQQQPQQQQSSPTIYSVGTLLNQKDSRWLQLEVCREYQRNKCSRTDNECKFAHPPETIEVQNGRVTACYDSIKGRCNRDKPPCKYFHPPQHLKDQLLINGRNHLALKNAVLQQYGFAGQTMLPGQMTSAVASPYMPQITAYQSAFLPGGPNSQMVFHPADQALLVAAAAAAASGQMNGHHHGQAASGAASPVSQQQQQHAAALMQHHHHQAAVAIAAAAQQQQQQQQQQHVKQRSDRIEVCREFQRGACKRADRDCRFAHPPLASSSSSADCGGGGSVAVTDDGYVTICMDHEKGRCARDPCRYFHRPDHLGSANSAGPAAAAAQQHMQLLQQQQQAAAAMLNAAAAADSMNATNLPVDLSQGLQQLSEAEAAEAAVVVAGKKRPRDEADEIVMAPPNMVPYKRPAASDKTGQPVYNQPTACTLAQPVVTSAAQAYGQQQQQESAAAAALAVQQQAGVAAAVAAQQQHNSAQAVAAYQQALLQQLQHQHQQPYVPVTYTGPATLAMPRYQ